jgi:hypothetical protein
MDTVRLFAAAHPLAHEVEVLSFSERRVVLIGPFIVGGVATLKLLGELGVYARELTMDAGDAWRVHGSTSGRHARGGAESRFSGRVAAIGS